MAGRIGLTGLPEVRIPGAAVLRASAFAAPLFRQVEAVGRRGVGADVTHDGLLSAKDLRAAAAALGVPPGSAVQRLWRLAQAAKLVVIVHHPWRSTAVAGPGLHLLEAGARGEADDEELLEVWFHVFATLSNESASATALLELYHAYPQPVADLLRLVQRSPAWPGGVHGRSGRLAERADARMLEERLDELEAVGALQWDDAGVRLTGLGAYGGNQVLSRGGFDAPVIVERTHHASRRDARAAGRRRRTG